MNLMSSNKSMNERKNLICSFEGCFKEFTKRRKLENHMRLHTGERPYVCDIPNCLKTYTNSSHLRRHKEVKHTDKRERIACTVEGCDRELANKTSLKKHIHRCHNSQRIYPFMCNECQQGFYRKQQLQEHGYLHTGELPFRCELCYAKFMTTRERNKHRRVHKEYTCQCGGVYNRWTTFLTHKKVCKLKNYKCNKCNKTFLTKFNLKMHCTTHLDKKDRSIYMCPYDECERYYFYRTNLTVHINTVHKKIQKPKIPCNFEGCNKLLNKMQNYKVHVKTHEELHRPKFPRKPRKDKGKIKKKIIDELCDITFSDYNKINKQIQLNNEDDLNSPSQIRLNEVFKQTNIHTINLY